MNKVIHRRTWEREQRRDRITGIAEQLVIERGLENVTFDEIAVAAGYTKRTMYHYFRDKEELFLAVVHKALLILNESLRQALENSGGLFIRALAWAYFRFFLDHPAYFDLIMRYESRTCIYYRGDALETLAGFNAACQQATDDTAALLTQAIADAMAQGHIKTTLEPKQMMLILWGQVSGMMQIILMRRDHFVESFGIDYEDLFTAFLDMVEHALTVGKA